MPILKISKTEIGSYVETDCLMVKITIKKALSSLRPKAMQAVLVLFIERRQGEYQKKERYCRG